MADLNTVSWKTSKEGHTYRVVRESIGKVGRIEISVVPRGDYHDLGQDPPSWVEMRHFISVRRTAGGSVPYATEVKVWKMGAKSLKYALGGENQKKEGNPHAKSVNNFSVRVQQTSGSWKTVQSGMRQAEAKKEAKQLFQKGWYVAVFQGRKKHWNPRE